MSIEAFNFSSVVVLLDGTVADVQQTDIQRGTRQDMTFFVAVRPHDAKPSFTGALHLSGSTVANLNACAVPGDEFLDTMKAICAHPAVTMAA